MSLNYTSEWAQVENTVSDRILDNSLLHTLSSDKKIKKQTKFLNQKLRKTRNNLRSYEHFLKLKRQVERACQDGDQTDDEPGLSHEAYKKIYNEQPKSQLRKFLRLCTRTKKPEYPEKTKRKSPMHESEKPNKSPIVKRPDYKNFPKTNVAKHRVKSTGQSISNSNNVQSKLQSTEKKLLNSKRANRSFGGENDNQSGIQKDDNTHERNCIKKIVQDLISSNIEKRSVDESSESNSDKVESTASKDIVIARNLFDELTDTKPEYDVTDRLKTCAELDKDSVVEAKQDSCNVITDVTENSNVSNSVSNCKEIFNKDNLLSQEDIFMTDDEQLGSEEITGNQNKNENYVDILNHDSGNNSFSDADVLRTEYENIPNVEAAVCCYKGEGLLTEHCSSISEDETIVPDNILQLEENVTELHGTTKTVSLDNEFTRKVKLSDRNFDSEASNEIESTEQLCDLQSETELSEYAAKDSKSKVKIRTIERYDDGYDIFSQHQLSKEKKLTTVNNFSHKSMENELTSQDERPLRSEISSEDGCLPQSESQYLNKIIDNDDSVKNRLSEQNKQSLRSKKSCENGNLYRSERQCMNRFMNREDSIDNELPSDNEQLMGSRKSSEDCNLSQNESQHLNDLIDLPDSSPLLKPNPEDLNNSMNNKSLLGGEEQADGNKTPEQYNTSEITSHRLNRSSNSSFSSFSARSYDEDLKNSVKTQLLSEIEQRLRDTPSPKKKKSLHRQSETLTGSLHDKAEISSILISSNKEDVEDELVDDHLLIEDSAQLSRNNRSAGESNLAKIQPQSSNRSSDIEDCFLSPKFSMPTKRRNSSNATDHCSIEKTPRSSKLPRLHKERTNRQLELISCERKSQEAISHKVQSTKNSDKSDDQNKQRLNACENVHRMAKRKPRPRNLEELVATETLTQDTTKPHFRLKDIGKDDEIWILEIPKTIDPKDLKDQVILLGGKSKLKLGDDCYKVSSKPAKSICNVSCIFATNRRKKQYKIANIESKGNIEFRQQCSVIPETKFISSKVAPVPFPKYLKMRHPLFGAAYEDKIS